VLRRKFRKSFTSFLFVHESLHPKEVFLALKEYLAPGASFAIFSLSIQPLSELMEKLDSNNAVNARIDELWTREH
jgi:tRNA A58 N-methylase Trm61